MTAQIENVWDVYCPGNSGDRFVAISGQPAVKSHIPNIMC